MRLSTGDRMNPPAGPHTAMACSTVRQIASGVSAGSTVIGTLTPPETHPPRRLLRKKREIRPLTLYRIDTDQHIDP